MDTPHLDHLNALWEQARQYGADNAKAIKDESKQVLDASIVENVPRLMKEHNLIVWCGNGDVTPDKRPCDQLTCQYKKAPDDVLAGCVKCHQFILAGRADTWNNANLDHMTDVFSGEIVTGSPFNR